MAKEPDRSRGKPAAAEQRNNHRQRNKWSTRQTANHPFQAVSRALPWHSLVYPGFPGILKESEIRSWCPLRKRSRTAQTAGLAWGGRTGQVSFGASKDLLCSQAGWKGFEIIQLVCCRDLPFLKEHCTGMKAGEPPFSGKRIKMQIIPIFPSSSTLKSISSSSAPPSPPTQKESFQKVVLPWSFLATEHRGNTLNKGEARSSGGMRMQQGAMVSPVCLHSPDPN